MTADEQVPDPNVVVSDTAALAANSAERAQAAAADAVANAQIAAAGVADQAANEVARTQEGLAQWQTTIQTRNEELADALKAQSEATQAKLAEAMDAILSIQARLDKSPENPASPESGSSEKTPPEEAESGETQPPAEPKPARRKAHRWI